MIKQYLLMAGYVYYPDGINDWIGFYDSKEEATRQMTKMEVGWEITRPDGQKIRVDWAQIVDLVDACETLCSGKMV